MRFRLLGQLFRLDFVPPDKMPKDRCGDCGPPRTDGRPRRIRILDNMSEKDTLDTILHEGLHGCSWHIDEEFVAKAARDLTRVLWRLGYRKQGGE